jgi:hypothetical protein
VSDDTIPVATGPRALDDNRPKLCCEQGSCVVSTEGDPKQPIEIVATRESARHKGVTRLTAPEVDQPKVKITK